ncbi:MAG: 1-phosphofructokinase family hexose kinase [Anaerolineae bacterium]
MIYTLTLNPTIDRTLTIEHFRVGGTFKAAHSALLPAGKGVNAGRVIVTLGESVTALGLVGANDMAAFAVTLEGAGIENKLLAVPGATRNSVTILDPADGSETHLREPGSAPPAGAVQEIEDRLASLSPGDWVLLAGSLPPGVPEDTYRGLCRQCAARGAYTLLDTNGPALLAGAGAPPTLLKPNLFELWQLDQRRPDVQAEVELDRLPVQEVLSAARRVRQRGVQMVVVSRGAQGILALDEEGGAWQAAVDLDRPVVDAVGSGDALAGGLLVGLVRGTSFAEALRLGVACGAANALLAGAGRCRRKDIDRLLRRARVHPIE